MLTPEKPAYTALVFAMGSVPPFIYVDPPIPIGILIFGLIYGAIKSDPHSVAWLGLADVLAMTAICLTAMSIAFLPLVYAGWQIKRRATRRLRGGELQG
jgi:hypothetical protein